MHPDEATRGLLLLTALLWAAIGATRLRAGGGGGRLACALMLGATWAAVGGPTTYPGLLPHGALALGFVIVVRTFAHDLRGASMWGTAAVVGLLVHWLGAAAPATPTATWPWTCQPWNLALGATIAGYGWRLRGAADERWLFVATGLGAAWQSVAATESHAPLAFAMLVGAAPMFLALAEYARRRLATSLALAAPATFALLLRANARADDVDLDFAGVSDPLLMLAAAAAALAAVAGRRATGTTADSAVVGSAVIGSETPGDAAATPATPPAPARATGVTTLQAIRNLREPLTSMIAAARLAEQDHEHDHDEVTEAASLIELRTFARQMAEMMDDIEYLESMRSDGPPLVDEVFDLHQVLQNCVDEARAHTEERELPIHFRASDDLPRWVCGDGVRTAQLVSRVLQLATHRCGFGVVTIDASCGADRLHLRFANSHAALESPDALATHIVTRLAEALGCFLHIGTPDGGGASYELLLPRRLAPEWEIDLMAADAETNTRPPMLPAKLAGNVLLITDNVDHQRLLGGVVTRLGVEFLSAQHGELAAHMLDQAPCDVVLLDLQADAANWLTTTRQLRRSKPDLPILGISSDLSPEHVEACLIAGCNDVLGKPVDIDELQRALSMHLAAVT